MCLLSPLVSLVSFFDVVGVSRWLEVERTDAVFSFGSLSLAMLEVLVDEMGLRGLHQIRAEIYPLSLHCFRLYSHRHSNREFPLAALQEL